MFDAEAVKLNIERDQSMTTSLRKAELRPVSSVEVIDPLTVRLRLSVPYAPLLAFLADRSGMMLSPQAIARLGDNVANHPSLRRAVLVHRTRGTRPHRARSVPRLLERQVDHDRSNHLPPHARQLGAAGQFANGPASAHRPNGRVRCGRDQGRSAFANRTARRGRLSHLAIQSQSWISRARLPLEGIHAFGWRWRKRSIETPSIKSCSKAYSFPTINPRFPTACSGIPITRVPERDLDGARALLQQAGVKRLAFTLELANTPVDAQIGEVIQAMARDAGFDINLEQLETNTVNAANLAGNFDVALLTWSGRADPDANLSIWMACNGPFNFGAYCDQRMDALLKEGRETGETEKRVAIYRKVVDLYLADMPQIILYNYTWIWGLSDRLEGFVPNRDGLIRPQGLRLKPQ